MESVVTVALFATGNKGGALHFHHFPCVHIPSAHVCARPRTSAHPCWLMPTGPSTQLFPPFPSHPHRPHTSAHPPLPTGPSPHPFPPHALHAPTPSAQVRATQLAPGAVSRLNENPSIEDAFGKNEHIKLQTICYYLILLAYLFVFSCK